MRFDSGKQIQGSDDP